jgi:hypothetical protein
MWRATHLGCRPRPTDARRLALGHTTLLSIVPAQQRAATTQTPLRPIGAGGARGASQSGSVSVITTTRSLCAQSPAQSEEWCCWFGRRRSIFGSAEIAAIRALQRCRSMAKRRHITLAEDPDRTRPERHFPSGAAQTRIISVARIRLDSRKSVRSFKGIICGDISEFESYHLSHAVVSAEPLECAENSIRPDAAAAQTRAVSGHEIRLIINRRKSARLFRASLLPVDHVTAYSVLRLDVPPNTQPR